MKLSDRIKRTLIGASIGDSVSWPTIFHHSNLLPFWTRRLRRDIDYESEEKNISDSLLPSS